VKRIKTSNRSGGIVAAKKNKWFKHYNTASQGHLVGNLIAEKNYAAVTLWWILLELVSQCESIEQRGNARLAIARIARAVNMKPSKVERLITHIAFVSHSDLECDLSEKQAGYVTFRLRNWAELQENRGGKRSSNFDQNSDRGKRVEVRGREEESKPNGFAPPPAGEGILKTHQELIQSLAIVELEKIKRSYPDPSWFEYETERCFTHFSLEPKETPRTTGKWKQKLFSWLETEWKKKRSEETKSRHRNGATRPDAGTETW
jgi:hypothetical protein